MRSPTGNTTLVRAGGLGGRAIIIIIIIIIVSMFVDDNGTSSGDLNVGDFGILDVSCNAVYGPLLMRRHGLIPLLGHEVHALEESDHG